MDEVIAGLHAEEDGAPGRLVQCPQVLLGHRTRTDLAAGHGEPVDRWAQVEPLVVLVEPALRQQAADETVYRTLRGPEGLGEFGEGDTGAVGHLFGDLRHAVRCRWDLRAGRSMRA